MILLRQKLSKFLLIFLLVLLLGNFGLISATADPIVTRLGCTDNIGTNQTTNTLTLSGTILTTDTIVVFGMGNNSYNGSPTPGPTDNTFSVTDNQGNTYAPAAFRRASNTFIDAFGAFAATSLSAGIPTTITFQDTATTSGIHVCAVDVSGGSYSLVAGSGTEQNSTANYVAPNVTTSSGTSLVFGGFEANANPSTFTPGGGYSSLLNNTISNNSTMEAEYRTFTSATTTTPTATISAATDENLALSFYLTFTPAPTSTPTNTLTKTATVTNTPTSTVTNTPTKTSTATNTPSNTPTVTPSVTNTPTKTATATNTPSNTPTVTPSVTFTPSNTATVTPSVTFTPSNTPTVTPSITFTPSNTPTITPSVTFTPSNTPTVTPSVTFTPSNTPTVTPSVTLTPTVTQTATKTATKTPTKTKTATRTVTATNTKTPTVTATASSTPTSTATPTLTLTPTITPPGAPTLIAPTGSVAEANPTFTWTTVDTATWYYLWVASPGNHILNQWYQAAYYCSGGTCSVAPYLNLPNGTYTFWVDAWNGVVGPWSSGTSFTVTGQTFGAGIPITPSGTITTAAPTFSWYDASGVQWYYLWVSGPSGTVLDQWYYEGSSCVSGVCSVSPTLTLTNGTYTWWVESWANNVFGPWSSGVDFTVNLPPAPAPTFQPNKP